MFAVTGAHVPNSRRKKEAPFWLFLFNLPVFGFEDEKAEPNWLLMDAATFSFLQQDLQMLPFFKEATVKASEYQTCVAFYKMGCRDKQLSKCFQTNQVAENRSVLLCLNKLNRTKLTPDKTGQLMPLMIDNCFYILHFAFLNFFNTAVWLPEKKKLFCHKLFISKLQQKWPCTSQTEEFVLYLGHVGPVYSGKKKAWSDVQPLDPGYCASLIGLSSRTRLTQVRHFFEVDNLTRPLVSEPNSIYWQRK